jgi:cephalosporin-C deacetylase-like acetyl esterase
MKSFAHILLSLLLVPATLFAANPAVRSERESGIYAIGEKVRWNIDTTAWPDGVKNFHYRIKTGGVRQIKEGGFELNDHKAVVEFTTDQPCWLSFEAEGQMDDGTKLSASTGVMVSPEKLTQAIPPPEDFDAFWEGKLKELAAVPVNPVLTDGESGNPAVIYQTIAMDNIRGTRIRGQIARPAAPGKFPAMLCLQYAGVYGLGKGTVVDRAAEGWLCLNIQAHDIDPTGPDDYYKQLSEGPFKGYESIGMEDRETCYFLRMYLACYRAADYLTNRDDWDGKILVVNGYSQGGQQTFITAALHPKVTAALACVPAGCDSGAPEAGRLPAYPWMIMFPSSPEAAAKVRETGRYYDAANFMPRVKCPLLVGIGGLDTVCPPSGVHTALNRSSAPKEIIFMTSVGHPGPHDAYTARFNQWIAAIKSGNSPIH